MTKKENYLCFTQNTKEHTTRAGTTIKIFLACCREFFIITFLKGLTPLAACNPILVATLKKHLVLT